MDASTEPHQLNESTVETTALEWFENLGYEILHGPDIAPGEPGQERDSFHDVLLADRLREAIDRLNPNIPAPAQEEAFREPIARRWRGNAGGRRRICQMPLTPS